MKRILMAFAFVGTTFFANANAPTPQSIDQVLTLTQAEKILAGIKPQVTAMMKAGIDQALKDRTPSAEEQKVLDNYVAKSTNIMSEVLTMDRLRPLYVQLYTDYFTQEDIDGLIVFYQSPAGKSMITKMPQLTQGLMAAMPKLMAPMLEQIQAAANQMATELEALKNKAPKPKS